MASETLTLEAPYKAEGALAGFLKSLVSAGPTPVAKLAKEHQSPTLLSAAAVHGLIEFGRPEYAHAKVSKVVKVKEGDIERESVVDDERKLHVGNGWSWSDLRKPGMKSVVDLLAEDSKEPLYMENPKLQLHVRVTTRGVAAIA